MPRPEFLSNLSPQQKKRLIVIAVIGGLILVSFGVAHLSKKETYRGLDTSTNVDVFIPKKKDTTLESLAGQVLSLEKRTQEMERYIKALEPNLKEMLQTKVKELGEQKVTQEETRLKALEEKVDMVVKELQKVQRGEGVPPTVKTPQIGQMKEETRQGGLDEAKAEGEEEEVATELRVVGGEEEKKSEAGGKEEKKEAEQAPASKDYRQEGGVSDRDMVSKGLSKLPKKEVYIPSGSIIQGVLLSGVDAPTGKNAPKNPVPALVRIKHEAILPNRFKGDVKECFVIVSGYGSLSTERANLRSERLSCVRPDGGVIETQMDGWVIGEDGKAGMRGRLVSKQGRIIANSLIAGVLSGMAKSFQPSQVPVLSLNPSSTAQIQWPNPEGVLSSAALGGAGTALEKIADYYLQMADEVFPVIEVDAGRKMTIVLVRGAKLSL